MDIENICEKDGKLVEKPEYFFKDIDEFEKVSVLKSIRARPEGIKNARDYMIKSCKMGKNKRKPIYVDDSNTVLDGNSTFNVIQNSKWDKMPIMRVKHCDKEEILSIVTYKIKEAEEKKNEITKFLKHLAENNEEVKDIIIPPLKSVESLSRKIAHQCFVNKGKIQPIVTWDVFRITIICDKKNFANDVKTLLEKISDKYVITWIDNSLCIPNTYAGLNVNFSEKGEDFQFEIQFHTEDTFEHKQLVHSIYEKLRTSSVEELKKKYTCDLIRYNNCLDIPSYTYANCKTHPIDCGFKKPSSLKKNLSRKLSGLYSRSSKGHTSRRSSRRHSILRRTKSAPNIRRRSNKSKKISSGKK